MCRSYSNYQCAGDGGDRIVRNVAAQQAHGHGFDPQNSDKLSMVGQASSSSSGEAETWEF